LATAQLAEALARWAAELEPTEEEQEALVRRSLLDTVAVMYAGLSDPRAPLCVRTPAVSLAPLIHHRAKTGLEGKFSLEFGIAAALLDGRPGIESFSDEAVVRPAAVRLAELVAVQPGEGGDHLLAGELELEVRLEDGSALRTTLGLPPGAPDRPPSDDELRSKLELYAGGQAGTLAALSWESAGAYLRAAMPASDSG
jgi:2-methylcitrate dehydratase PrpD